MDPQSGYQLIRRCVLILSVFSPVSSSEFHPSFYFVAMTAIVESGCTLCTVSLSSYSVKLVFEHLTRLLPDEEGLVHVLVTLLPPHTPLVLPAS